MGYQTYGAQNGAQKGDGFITVSGKNYGLRLTMGALAELDTRLSLSGPAALAKRLRHISPDEARVLLACVMRPCSPSRGCAASAASFSEADIAAATPAVCRLFEEAFSHE